MTNLPIGGPCRIIVPVFNALEDVVECVESLCAHTPPEAQILLIDDASTDAAVQPTLEALAAKHGLRYVRKPVNTGFVGSCNLGFELAKPHDVVIVNSDVIVPADWLPRLQAAAYHRSNIATATPFTNHGSIVSLPHIDRPSHNLPLGMSLAEVDDRVRRHSLRLYPIIPTAIGHLTYIKRSAIDTVVVGFDEAFAPGYGEEVDFSQRTTMAGFCHVVADDLFVHHKGSKSFGGPNAPQKEQRRREIQEAHERLINQRHPWYEAARGLNASEIGSKFPASPFARAAERARASLLGYDIAIDATCVSQYTTGTQVVTLELINALIDCLAANQRANAPVIAKLSIIVADGPMPDILKTIAARAGDVATVVRIHDLRQRFKDDNAPRFDLIHRPFQLTSSRDLLFLLTAARRFIVSQLDCIAYANPSYALNAESWLAYRQLTERVFAMADGISYISADAQHDAKHRGLLMPPERECVAYVGVDHQLHRSEIGAEIGAEASATAEMATLLGKIGTAPFLLVLGTNFRHKNRVYAIRMLQALIAQHAWPGNVVFAGPNVTAGGSVQEEAEAVTGDFAQRVIYLGAIDEVQKNWLMQKSALVLYPSNYEGFGMVPFEAAQLGVPCLALRNTSVAEVLGDGVRYLESNDPQAGVELVWQMLSTPDVAAAQVAVINVRAARFNWGTVAQDTLAFYDRVLRLPARRAELHSSRGGVSSAELVGEETTVSVAANGWLQRGIKAVTTLRREGRAGLRREIDQYLRWKRGQF